MNIVNTVYLHQSQILNTYELDILFTVLKLLRHYLTSYILELLGSMLKSTFC